MGFMLPKAGNYLYWNILWNMEYIKMEFTRVRKEISRVLGYPA